MGHMFVFPSTRGLWLDELEYEKHEDQVVSPKCLKIVNLLKAQVASRTRVSMYFIMMSQGWEILMCKDNTVVRPHEILIENMNFSHAL